jgi:hypothetical protein
VTDALIVRRLWIVLIVYEALVITIVAGAGLNIGLQGGGSIAMAAPLALIACAEALRIPLSAMATRLRLTGKLLAAVALLAIAVGSTEGLVVAFEAFLQNRVVEIMRAEGDVERAQRVVDTTAANVASHTNEVKELDAEISALASSRPSPPSVSNRTCSWRGQKVSCSVDATAVAAYRDATRAYDARLASLTAQRSALQGQVDAARAAAPPEASETLLEAKRTFEEKASQSPVWRLTAAVYGEDAADVTPAQFSRVKAFVSGTLALTFATLSMVISIVVHAKLRSEAPSRVERAVRGFLVRWRKRLVIHRDVPGPVQDRVVVRWTPYDVARGIKVKPEDAPAEVYSAPWGKS